MNANLRARGSRCQRVLVHSSQERLQCSEKKGQARTSFITFCLAGSSSAMMGGQFGPLKGA